MNSGGADFLPLSGIVKYSGVLIGNGVVRRKASSFEG